VDIIFKGLHTDVLDRFRKQASVKLAKIEKLDHKAIRVDVAVTAEHNPRQSQRRERVELTISSRGPAIRAEAAAEDRYVALDIAFAKLESRLRRACDRRKGRHGAHAAVRVIDLPAAGDAGAEPAPADEALPETADLAQAQPAPDAADAADVAPDAAPAAARDATGNGHAADGSDDLVPIAMEGDGPLVVREKFHGASPMAIDQALFEMEMVGHDFYLYRDAENGCPSVVYRRRGYQYGVIRLVDTGDQANGRAGQAGRAMAARLGQDAGQNAGQDAGQVGHLGHLG
jgi:ribosomal subunit interface protein